MRRYDLLTDDLSSASYEEVFEALQGFRDEAERVEFKSEPPDRSTLVKVACAFANAFGGIIAIGVQDPDKTPEALTPSEKATDISNRAQTAMLSRITARTYPSVRCQSFGFRSHDDHRLLLIRVPRTIIGPHQYLGNDGPPLPVRRDKEISALSLPEIEALQQRRDGGTLTSSPLGSQMPLVAIQPPVIKRGTNNAQLCFFGAVVVPQEYNASVRVLYDDDESAIRSALTRCVGLSGIFDKTMRDGLLFSTEENRGEEARSQRDAYVQSDGEIALRMEQTNEKALYQLCRLLGNVFVLSAYTYLDLGIAPRIRGFLQLELSDDTKDDRVPRHWQERFAIDLANDDFLDAAGKILTLTLRGAGTATAPTEMRYIFEQIWMGEFAPNAVRDLRELWS